MQGYWNLHITGSIIELRTFAQRHITAFHVVQNLWLNCKPEREIYAAGNPCVILDEICHFPVLRLG